MRNTIRKLRNKPESARRMMVLVFSVGITALITIFCVSTLSTSVTISKANVSDQFKPLTLLKNSIVNEWNSLKGNQGASVGSALDGNPSINTSNGDIKVSTNENGQTEVQIGGDGGQ